MVQDDAQELKADIHCMDRIFSAANLTIVAASGHNANCGLSGVHPGSRQISPVTATVEKIGLAQREPW
jgi:hypothetical protein